MGGRWTRRGVVLALVGVALLVPFSPAFCRRCGHHPTWIELLAGDVPAGAGTAAYVTGLTAMVAGVAIPQIAGGGDDRSYDPLRRRDGRVVERRRRPAGVRRRRSAPF